VASTHQKENYTTLIYQDFGIGIDLNRNRDKVFGSTKGSTTTLIAKDWDYRKIASRSMEEQSV
jgi:hypothetical protein